MISFNNNYNNIKLFKVKILSLYKIVMAYFNYIEIGFYSLNLILILLYYYYFFHQAVLIYKVPLVTSFFKLIP